MHFESDIRLKPAEDGSGRNWHEDAWIKGKCRNFSTSESVLGVNEIELDVKVRSANSPRTVYDGE